MPLTPSKKCPFCNKAVINGRAKYCPTCSKFAFRIMNTRMSPEAIKGIREYVHETGFLDYYTKMPLEMTDTQRKRNSGITSSSLLILKRRVQWCTREN
jgi:hypothetical protein